MRHHDLSPGQALLAMTLMLTIATASADSLTGRVVKIADGDTLTLAVGRQHHKIRIAAIDAPERYQAWGDRSRTHLSSLALNQAAVANCSGFDQWGHRLCKLTVNNRDIGLTQIEEGMAWWSRQNANEQPAAEQSAYGSAELMAKLKRRGLWRDTNPMPPWDFRGGY